MLKIILTTAAAGAALFAVIIFGNCISHRSRGKKSAVFENFSRKDMTLWIVSLCTLVISNAISGNADPLTLTATLIGVTSLIFAAKGDLLSQLMMIIFSVLYGIISYRFHYWGEMITYLGMTLPMAVWSAVTWYKNPSKNNQNEVAIQKLKQKQILILVISTAIVTFVFYFILRSLDTPNIIFSVFSVTTSFAAASLTMLRSPYFALAYAANDIVLIVLWVFASAKDPDFIPVAVNFIIFFFNDLYGFLCWRKREEIQ